MTFIKWRYYH